MRSTARNDVKRHTEDNSPKYRMVGKMKENNSTDKVHSLFTIHHSLKRPAFTLAEVLITLGIIGVVAALTLPSLITKYRNQAYVTQLKKTVSTLEQGFQLMKADDGVDKLQDTSVFTSTGGWMFISSTTYSYKSSEMYKLFSKYFKFVGDDVVSVDGLTDRVVFNTLSGPKATNSPIGSTPPGMFLLPDGSLVGFVVLTQGTMGTPCEYAEYAHIDKEKCDSVIGDISIDVNGIKRPNQYGRDVFWFWLTEKGKLVPNGGDYAVTYSKPSWKTDKTLCGEKGKPIGTGVTGFGCAGRVVENGWKIDY